MQIICFKFWFVAALLFLLTGDGFCQTVPKADLAWPESDGNKTEIYYNAYRHGQWLGKTQITNDQYNNMHPKMAVTDDGTIFLVWTALNGMENKLFYSIKTDGSWTYPKEIETGIKSSIAPSLAVDRTGTPWIAWAGYNGVADDIYVSFWKGSRWSKPRQINPPNTVPDILPEIRLSENESLVVTWQGYDGEQYQYYQSTLHGNVWGKPVLVPRDSLETSAAVSAGTDILNAPGKASKGSSGKATQPDIPMPESFHPIKRDKRLYDLKIR